jgi:hypothetical protein
MSPILGLAFTPRSSVHVGTRGMAPHRPSPGIEGVPTQLLHAPDEQPVTVEDVADLWLARGRGRDGASRPSTAQRFQRAVERYLNRSADPETEPIGAMPFGELTVDTVAAWSAANERTLAPTTALFALTTLRQICRFAVRRGWLATDPVRDLEPAETALAVGQGRGPRRDGSSASSTVRTAIGRCSSSWPSPGCGWARRSG